MSLVEKLEILKFQLEMSNETRRYTSSEKKKKNNHMSPSQDDEL